VIDRRLDLFTGRHVIIAPGRRSIGGVRAGGLPEPGGRCPFCPGHEPDTETTIAAWPDEAAWQVRVVTNKFPIARDHEVVIESRDHGADLPDLEHAGALLRVIRDRARALERDPSIAAVIVFRNRGRRAGSSQPHPHTQIVGVPFVPADIELRARVAQQYVDAHGERIDRAMLRRELEERVRVVDEDPHFVTFCPHAPSRPFEVRVAPRSNEAFAMLDDAKTEALATALVGVTRRLRRAIALADYNVIVRQPPARAAGGWYVEILPRLGGDAGFELATGELIVVVSPEDAAVELRRAGMP
jgi:UDPglucose--hexose-1-phosphate uridylyltransferase